MRETIYSFVLAVWACLHCNSVVYKSDCSVHCRKTGFGEAGSHEQSFSGAFALYSHTDALSSHGATPLPYTPSGTAVTPFILE